MREPVRELAVVRQQQRAGRVRVEPPDRHDALGQVHERDDRAAAPADRDAVVTTPAGLCSSTYASRCFATARPSTSTRSRAATNVFSCPASPLTRHAPGLDQLVRLPPRRDAGPREVRVQTHARYCPRMPHYVTLMRWTSQGIAGLPAWRERIEEGERIIEDAGGTLVGVYVTLGRYDVVEIFEAPDDELAVEILMKLQRFGAEHTETLRAFTRDEAEEIIRRL